MELIKSSPHDVVQPDVLVVCDEKKITEKNIQGVPDLVVEVLSPNTAIKDKRLLYEKVGIREYIIIDPTEQYVERYLPDEEGFYGIPDIFGPKEVVKLKAFEEIEIPLWEVFETEPPERE
ncbi:MAG: Uma2 family endonuclease [Nitrospirota bacterium]|nr:Uma2 family endonuclease [Nitrospirota bacterium]